MRQVLRAVSAFPSAAHGAASQGAAFWFAVVLAILVPLVVIAVVAVRIRRDSGRPGAGPAIPDPYRARRRRAGTPRGPAASPAADPRPRYGSAVRVSRQSPLPPIKPQPVGGNPGIPRPARSGGRPCAMCGRPATEHTQRFAGRMLCPGSRSGTYSTPAELDHMRDHPGYYPEGPSGF